MRTVFRILMLIISLPAVAQHTKHVILISIDGLRPEMYLDASWPAPNLQQLMRHGAYAQRMRSVFPSFTYPSHVAMLTGAFPARSGISHNVAFDPDGKNVDWNWFTKDINVPTLWQVLKRSGLTTAAVQWPVSVDPDITYNIPEIWNTDHAEDRITETRKYATPGLIEEIEANATGSLNGENMNEEYVSLDDNASRIAAYIFKKYKPNFLALHFACVDGAQHAHGRETPEVRLAVAAIDRAIGNIREAVERSDVKNNTTILIVGDHGFMDMHSYIRPNLWLKQHKIMGEGKDWKAKFQPAGGSAFLRLQNSKDKETLSAVQKMLAGLPEKYKRLFNVMDRPELDKLGVDSNAVLALAAVPGIVFSGAAEGELMGPVSGGHHGWDPRLPEMYTGFIASGAGINNLVVPELCVVDIAPLVAALLGVRFDSPDGIVIQGLIAK